MFTKCLLLDIATPQRRTQVRVQLRSTREVLEVDFLAQLRQIRSFDSVDDLTRQLAIDLERTADIVARHPR